MLESQQLGASAVTIARSGQLSVVNLLPLLMSCEPRDRVACRILWSNACSSISRELAVGLRRRSGGAMLKSSYWELARDDRPFGLDAIAFKNGQAS
jgi:hypothetical protein